MGEFERSVTVDATPETVFRSVSTVSHLPRFLPGVWGAQPEAGDHVRIWARWNGYTHDVSGLLRVERDQGRVAFQSDGDPLLGGWLLVRGVPGSPCQSEVIAHLSLQPLLAAAQQGRTSLPPAVVTIQEDLRRVLEAIKLQVEALGAMPAAAQERGRVR